ncbi:hypothetical protein ACFL4T_00670 [candidate division KSB1 bacterium]
MKKIFPLFICLFLFANLLTAQSLEEEYYDFQQKLINEKAQFSGNPLPWIKNTLISVNADFGKNFGFWSFYSKRKSYDTFLTVETGFWFYSNFSPLDNTIDSGSENPASAYIIPVYIGLRKYLNFSDIFCPYYSLGGGFAFGMGTKYEGSNIYLSNFGITPTAYAGLGASVGINNNLSLNIELRPRLLIFTENIGNWKNFSGITLIFGFAYTK